MSFRQHVAILRSFAWLIVLSLAVAIAASLLITAITPRSYEARATLSVGQPLSSESVDYNDLLASQLLARTYARLVSTGPLLDAAAASVDLRESVASLRNRVRTEVQAQDTLIDIVVRDAQADQAARIANALAAELLARTPQTPSVDVQSITKQIAALDVLIAQINQQIEELSAVTAPTAAQEAELDALTRRLDAVAASRGVLEAQLPQSAPGKLTLVDPATAPNSPAGPGRSVVILLSALVALISSVALAYGISAWRTEPGDHPLLVATDHEGGRQVLSRLGRDRP
jgi:capsular polysaccharide biosynthesis protein